MNSGEDDFSVSSPSPSPSPTQQSKKRGDDDLSGPDYGNEVPRWCYTDLGYTRPKKRRRRSSGGGTDGVAMKDIQEMKVLLQKVCKKVEKNEKYLKELQYRSVVY